MTGTVVLTDLNDKTVISVEVDNIENKRCFSYVDNDSNKCEISVYDDGLRLNKQGKDHSLVLNLRNDSYALIGTPEGEVKLDIKVVDFIEKNDILVMHYIVDEIEREIKVIYGS